MLQVAQRACMQQESFLSVGCCGYKWIEKDSNLPRDYVYQWIDDVAGMHPVDNGSSIHRRHVMAFFAGATVVVLRPLYNTLGRILKLSRVILVLSS